MFTEYLYLLEVLKRHEICHRVHTNLLMNCVSTLRHSQTSGFVGACAVAKNPSRMDPEIKNSLETRANFKHEQYIFMFTLYSMVQK